MYATVLAACLLATACRYEPQPASILLFNGRGTSAGDIGAVENILRGIHNSLADRALSLLKRVGLDGEVTLIGGVARQAGMVAAPAQLDDPNGGARSPIGSGPFVFENWTPDSSLTVKKNSSYWRAGLPYLDEIEFRPIPEPSSNYDALRSGDVTMMATSDGPTKVKLREGAAAGDFQIVNSAGETDEASVSRDIVIDQGTARSGGLHDRLLTSMSLAAKLQQVANMLTHEYRITYAHPDTLIPPDKVTVSVRRADLTARGRLAKVQASTIGPQARP